MENSSNNNWLSLLRRKIQKKFKRNRQKVCNVEEIENQQQENSETNQNIENHPEATAEQEINPVETSTSEDTNSTIQNCEEMKTELSKLKWYWPNLK
jgi:hypothetical protein